MQPFVIDVESVAIEGVDTYLEPVSAPSNYKSPDAIERYQVEKRKELVERAALDIDLARIIALGISRAGYATEVRTTEHTSESDVLAWLWEQWHKVEYPDRTFVTFNGCSYDVPLLLRRSLYLGVKAPVIQCDRFKHPQVTDLMALLSMDGKLKLHSLNFYLQRFGYPKGGPDITGADIAERYAAGDWAAITRHCKLDVEGTKWLAERIGAVPKSQPVGVAVGF